MLFSLLVIIIILSLIMCHSSFSFLISSTALVLPSPDPRAACTAFLAPLQQAYHVAVGSISHPRPLSLELLRLQYEGLLVLSKPHRLELYYACFAHCVQWRMTEG
ncbi:hypothetical protein BDV41DRAFT_537052 [Aspergillus transmontanensis]|uniref:Uncharacterized protein n=1 Tax=Aspergillus transmontanensis TaxID=1034304 RepID=A0A5N6VY26_9EURO|nr:hypothetical protein BDV41DRAFT_537052 [Aspergillus transmontanensis]